MKAPVKHSEHKNHRQKVKFETQERKHSNSEQKVFNAIEAVYK